MERDSRKFQEDYQEEFKIEWVTRIKIEEANIRSNFIKKVILFWITY